MGITEFIRAERDYGSFSETLIAQLKTSARPRPIVVSGLCEGAATSFYTCLAVDVNVAGGTGTLFLVPGDTEAATLFRRLSNAGIRTLLYPTRDLLFHNAIASHESEHERLFVLAKIMSGEWDAVVATPDAALSFTMPPSALEERIITLSLGEEIPREELLRRLTDAGYVRAEEAGGVGLFSIRGGIIDIYPMTLDDAGSDNSDSSKDGNAGDMRLDPMPVRLEFFGDEIDRISIFDPETQRTINSVTKTTILPVRELCPRYEERKAIEKVARSLAEKAKDETVRAQLSSEAEYAANGLSIPSLDKYMKLVFGGGVCLLDYFEDMGRMAIITTDVNGVKKRLDGYMWQLGEDIKEMLADGLITPELAEYSFYEDKLDLFREKNAHVACSTFSPAGMSGRSLAGLYGFSSRRGIAYSGNMSLLAEDAASFLRGGYKIAVACGNETAAEVTASALRDAGVNAVAAPDVSYKDMKPGVVYTIPAAEAEGYELLLSRIVLLSFTSDTENRRTKSHTRASGAGRRAGTASQKILSYNDLTPGDYVVHEAYGIGRYLGIENLTTAGVSRDYIKIQYAGSDLLYLPTDQLGLVSKYIGANADGIVKLSKMGGADWVRAKSRAKAAAKDMAKELITLYAERKRKHGYAFPPDDEYQRGFELAFEYEDTEAQLLAIEEIKRDMESPWPMDRLLCGDVGYGKTEVALRAAFKAILAGKQVAFLVPTTILAYQHFTTAMARMRPYPITIEMLSRFRSPAQQEEILRKLRRGEIDMIIGTHRIISQDVKFRDLGLLIIDEEQRFGVAQKEKLKQLARGVDVLTLTATPIPRTLNMAMNGIRDMSILDEAPGNRYPVQTYVLEHDDAVILETIRRELRRDGQVFYLYNRIDGIHIVADRLRRSLPEARIAVAHGQMNRERLELIWQSLLDGEIDVLVSTTIIETGIDVPNANTLIIEDADRLGLAQLHQLRGRVGRSGRRAYAYFTFKRGKALSEEATNRLEAIREYTEFGAGFRIALRDMEIRGTGNLLGPQQHGHLNAVGYDMYIRLLEAAVLEEKGELALAQLPECTVDLREDAYLPQSYIFSSRHRMEMYKKIANIENEDDVRDMYDELTDRFGEPPAVAKSLLNIALIRGLGRATGIRAIEQRAEEISIKPHKLEIDVWAKLVDAVRCERNRQPRIVSADPPYITVRLTSGERPTAVVLSLLKKFIQIKDGAM